MIVFAPVYDPMEEAAEVVVVGGAAVEEEGGDRKEGGDDQACAGKVVLVNAVPVNAVLASEAKDQAAAPKVAKAVAVGFADADGGSESKVVAVADAAGGGHEDKKSGAGAGDGEEGKKEGGGHSTVKRMVNGEVGVYRDLSSNKLHHPRLSKRQESDALLENRPDSPDSPDLPDSPDAPDRASKGGGGAGGDVARGKKKGKSKVCSLLGGEIDLDVRILIGN